MTVKVLFRVEPCPKEPHPLHLSSALKEKIRGPIMTTQEIKDQIIKNLDKLPPDALEGVLEYVEFISEPETVTPTIDELNAIRRGEEEYSKGECVRWRDIKRHDV